VVQYGLILIVKVCRKSRLFNGPINDLRTKKQGTKALVGQASNSYQ